jgi:hypothetical protein
MRVDSVKLSVSIVTHGNVHRRDWIQRSSKKDTNCLSKRYMFIANCIQSHTSMFDHFSTKWSCSLSIVLDYLVENLIVMIILVRLCTTIYIQSLMFTCCHMFIECDFLSMMCAYVDASYWDMTEFRLHFPSVNINVGRIVRQWSTNSLKKMK